MAAITVSRRRSTVWGDYRTILATVTVASSGDTFTTGYHLIDDVSFDQKSGAGTMGVITNVGGVITFTTSGGSVTGYLQVNGK